MRYENMKLYAKIDINKYRPVTKMQYCGFIKMDFQSVQTHKENLELR